MTVTDPIADLLTRMRNAQMAGKNATHAPYSKMKESVCEVLKTNKFIANYTVNKSNQFPELEITFDAMYPRLELKRISKPGQRIYIGKTEIPRVKNGMGIGVLSTPQGVMCTKSAKKKGLGGELLCLVS